MILKCRECDQAMLETKKGRPEKLPSNVKWIVCRNCDKGIEVIGDEAQDVGEVIGMNWTETVSVTHYITQKQNKKGVKKYTYLDKERTKLLKEEDIA